jgi:hypothetical protein
MSNDGTNFRAILGATVSKCGRLVRSTNQDRIWVQEVTALNPPIDRNMSSQEVSMSSLMVSQDFYLFHRLSFLIQREHQAVLRHDCEARRRADHLHFYLEYQDPSLTTWTYGHKHSQRSGEVVYQFDCVPELVRLVEQPDECLETPKVIRTRKFGENETNLYEGKDLYLIALTRRLTTIPIRGLCSSTFPAKWQSNRGNWFILHPRLLPTTPPASPESAPDEPVQLSDSLAFSKPGIYDEKQLHELEVFQMIGHTRAAIFTALTDQIQTPPTDGDGYIHQERMFPRMPNPLDPATQWYKKFVEFMHSFGYLCSIFVSLVFG